MSSVVSSNLGNEELNSGVGDGLVLNEELVMVDSSVMVLNSRTSGVASTCDARGSVETSNIEFGATFSSAQPVAPSLAYEESTLEFRDIRQGAGTTFGGLL